tara:strand:- start:11735 stop:13018 length:1284 start_codon:yes stop_codon:yes gene_type:complete
MFSFIYSFLINIIYIPFILVTYFRIFIKKEHSSKFKEKIIFNKIKRPEGFLFWFHVASIGEFRSIIPFVNFFLKNNQKFNILITTITLSSYNEFLKYYENNERVFHQFLPYDQKYLVKHFLNSWKPNIVSFVDSEIWPNFISNIKKEKLPFILLNARITKKTLRRWQIFKSFSKDLFGSFSLCISASKETEQNLKILEAKNIKFFGNIKFCSNLSSEYKFSKNELKNIFNKKIWCAVSTHRDEERFCANVHTIVKKKERDSICIIIPRHINRINKILKDIQDSNLKIQIKNEKNEINESAELVLVNYYGAVNKYLNNINQIFIGKSLVSRLASVGGQNPIDAAKLGCRIYHGPYVYNFQEIYDFLDKSKIAEQVNEPWELAEKIIQSFNDKGFKNNEKLKELEIYSDTIFNKVVNEYKKLINENSKT